MNPTKKKSIVRQLLMTLWAMVTLVLCFVVALLVNEMLKRGENPLTAFAPETETWPEHPDMTVSGGISAYGTRDVPLFFASEDGHWLAPETLVIEFSGHTVDNCRKAFLGLVAGPRDEVLLPLLPGQTQLRAMYLRENGELVLDLSSEFLTSQQRPKSAEMEALMVYGIVNTVTQPMLQGENDVPVRMVRFLFDGAIPQDAFPAHVDLSAPIVQDKRWTRTGLE